MHKATNIYSLNVSGGQAQRKTNLILFHPRTPLSVATMLIDTNSPFVLDWRNALGLALSVLVAFISGPGGSASREWMRWCAAQPGWRPF